MGKCDKLFPRNALLATTPPGSQHMPKYVRGEVTKEAREELSRAAPTSASQCRRRHRAIPGAEFPEHVQLGASRSRRRRRDRRQRLGNSGPRNQLGLLCAACAQAATSGGNTIVSGS